MPSPTHRQVKPDKKKHKNNTHVQYTLSKKSIFIEKILQTDTTKNVYDRVILTLEWIKGDHWGSDPD